MVELLNEAFPSCHPETGLERISKKGRLAAINSKVSIATDAWHSKVGNMEWVEMIGTEMGKLTLLVLIINHPISPILFYLSHFTFSILMHIRDHHPPHS